jgi:hypothetical protein
MGIFQLIRPDVLAAITTIANEVVKATTLQSHLNGLAERVPQAWIGDDANEFSTDFTRRVVPAMVELIAAIGGINVNLNKGIAIVDAADQNAARVAANLTSKFKGITA